ncbi:MAG: hypothetical protein RR839_01890 [Oscillospiraceae bacterium]
MQELNSYKKMLNIVIIISAVALFLKADSYMFVLYYILMMFFMIFRTFRISVKISVKIYLIVTYTLLAIAQTIFCSPSLFSPQNPPYLVWLNSLLCVSFLAVPPLLEKIITVKKYIGFRLPSLDEVYVLSFAELKANKEKVFSAVSKLKKAKSHLTMENLEELALDFPRHSSFKYVNNGNLTDRYFEKAYESLDDNHIYLVISDTGSPASEVFSVFTQKSFNHSSIAFDNDLTTIVSYNGGEKVYPPGLNYEMIELFCKKIDASILVYSLECSREQKKIIIDKIKEINEEGSAYNLMGLLLKQSFKPNIMFCSQFVYSMLNLAGLNYFEMTSKNVRPTDFIECDYYRKLKFEYEITSKRTKMRGKVKV